LDLKHGLEKNIVAHVREMVSETAEHIDSPGRGDPSGEVAVYGIFRDGAVRVAWRHSFE
jgi:hypothetical protein